MVYPLFQENAGKNDVISAGGLIPEAGSMYTLTDDELLLIAGGAGVGSAVVGALQGAVVGGVSAAVGAAATGAPIGTAGIAGMAGGLVTGAVTGYTSTSAGGG